ncbi:hypothetical protein [Actinoplanes flavus]|uniref:Uncharacterized protein n=1 Tax=Actinoplanes flavus TaxID=2820290 RepID=A0ABS3V056_9ACTN|nr:hypothetical protein [Actinoplanes flavus]MBO3744156.1 hypothetical protein [Actinoplanes flavus]
MRIVLVIAGVALIVYAAAGAVTDPDVAVGGVLLFLAGVLAVHDIVWMATVLAVGAAITRLVAARHQTVARATAISAATITFVAFPLVLGFGRSPGNPSVLPLPYGRNLALVLLGIAAVTVLIGWRGGREKLKGPAPGINDPRRGSAQEGTPDGGRRRHSWAGCQRRR